MKNYFEIITYGENKVRDYAYAFSSNSSIFREFKDDMSIIKWYYCYQALKNEEFSLRASSRSQFIADVFLVGMPISSIVESILELDIDNRKKAALIDFYYLSSSRVTSLFEFLDSLQENVSESIDQILLAESDFPTLTVYSKVSQKAKEFKIENVGTVRIKLI